MGPVSIPYKEDAQWLSLVNMEQTAAVCYASCWPGLQPGPRGAPSRPCRDQGSSLLPCGWELDPLLRAFVCGQGYTRHWLTVLPVFKFQLKRKLHSLKFRSRLRREVSGEERDRCCVLPPPSLLHTPFLLILYQVPCHISPQMVECLAPRLPSNLKAGGNTL